MKRIDDETVKTITSLDDLIEKMKKSEVGNLDEFKRRYEYFKKVISEEYSEFTIEELLKFDEHRVKLMDLYDFKVHQYLFIALEYENEINNKKS